MDLRNFTGICDPSVESARDESMHWWRNRPKDRRRTKSKTVVYGMDALQQHIDDICWRAQFNMLIFFSPTLDSRFFFFKIFSNCTRHKPSCVSSVSPSSCFGVSRIAFWCLHQQANKKLTWAVSTEQIPRQRRCGVCIDLYTLSMTQDRNEQRQKKKNGNKNDTDIQQCVSHRWWTGQTVNGRE